MSRSFLFIGLLFGVAILFVTAGCNKQDGAKAVAPAPSVSSTVPADDHGHKPSAHGGILVAIGRDSYHAEAVFEKGGTLRLYMLGQDESKVLEIETQELTAYVRPDSAADSETVVLKPTPQPGDKPGMTSQFTATLPATLQGKKVEVTIPNVTIRGERFRIGFASAVAHTDEMPTSDLNAEEERKLYLTAGGKYTAEDIKANGNVTASQKFRDFRPKHDLKPKVGDKICPVTLTKANPACAWIVGGKKYEFCCPPCVEEFVKLAKDSPADIKEPEAYVKK